jgi:hypothetical protein
MKGAGALGGTRWHFDEGISTKPFLIYVWQGPGTIYCETRDRIPSSEDLRQKEQQYDDVRINLTSTHQVMSPYFSHDIIWKHVKSAVGQALRVQGRSVYDYLAEHPSLDVSHSVSQALREYENFIYYNATKLNVTIRNVFNDRVKDAFEAFRLDEVCTSIGGTVYATPPGYMAMHATQKMRKNNDKMNDRGAALHRGPAVGYENKQDRSRFFIIMGL